MTFSTLYNSNPVANVQTGRLELLLVEIGGTSYALRAAHILRLAREASLQLRQDKTPIANQSSYIGYIRQLEIPVYDLSLLLGETTTATVQGNEQVILMKDAGSYEQAYGFRVTNTTEVITVNLAELAPLPEIVEYNKTQPLVWALWLKFTNDNKLELINLIDPIAIVKNTHFE